jgi:hypothetical protein
MANRFGLTAQPQVPNEIKREAANALGVYVDDIGRSAVRQSETPYGRLYGPDAAAIRATEDFNRPDFVDFAQALGMDEPSARQLGLTIAGWAEQRALPHVGIGNQSPVGDLTESLRPVGLVTGAIEDGFDAIGTDRQRANIAFAQGVGALTGVVAAAGGFGGMALTPAVAPWVVNSAGAVGAGGGVYAPISIARPPNQPMTGATLENVIVGQLREDLATAVAQSHPDRFGPAAQLAPGTQSQVLGEYYPAVRDALDRLDLSASDKARDYGELDHWSPR